MSVHLTIVGLFLLIVVGLPGTRAQENLEQFQDRIADLESQISGRRDGTWIGK